MYVHLPAVASAPQDGPLIARQSFDLWKGILVALYAVGALTTLVRLSHRVWSIKTSRLSWRKELWTFRSLGDYLALAASCWGVVASIVILDLYLAKDTHERIPYQKRLYYVMSVAWTSGLWLPRVVLALALWSRGPQLAHPRIGPLGLSLSVCFTLMYLTHMAWHLATGCGHHGRTAPDVQTTAYCNTGKQGVAEVGFVGLLISELSLVAASAYALVISKRSAAETTLVAQAGFRPSMRATYHSVLSASVVLLLITIAHCAFQYSPLVTGTDGLLVKDMTAQLEAALSIMACNVPELVALFRRVAYLESDPPVTVSPRVSVVMDLKVPVTVLRLSQISATSREKDRKLGLHYAETDVSSVKSWRSL